jgi:hypothetical protein
MQAHLEKFRRDAEECALIGNARPMRRESFSQGSPNI